MYTLLSLDVVGRALDFPQGNVTYSLLGKEGGKMGGCVEGIGGGEKVGIWVGFFLKKLIKKKKELG